ncbi:hypothetical protein ACFQZQ_13360 [Lysobacter koreensis]|uniref:Uncharacterized protein n=1 Tax=Lysobacter koreensis TaxID=266122 RepID=A0ABW2YQH3_9GAMM
MKTADVEISLALRAVDRISTKDISRLAEHFDVVDKSANGWGWVIEENGSHSSVDEAVIAFVSRLTEFRDQIAQADPVFRVAVYNPNFTYTCRLSCAEQISSFSAVLEISVYPTEDD